MQCGNCGKQLPDSASFCTDCGWKTEKWAKEVQKANTIKKTVMANTLVAIISFVVLVVFFIIAVNS